VTADADHRDRPRTDAGPGGSSPAAGPRRGRCGPGLAA
jgi:hypothetical protein